MRWKPGRHPVDRIGFIAYAYDSRGNLERVTADAPGVPFIDYTPQYTAGSSSGTTFSPGRDRLLSMTYLGHAGYSGPRTITFDYGNATGLDALVDRASSCRMGNSQVAAFTYTGSGWRVATVLGGSATTPWVRQTFDTDPNTHALEGLDASGRAKGLPLRRSPHLRAVPPPALIAQPTANMV